MDTRTSVLAIIAALAVSTMAACSPPSDECSSNDDCDGSNVCVQGSCTAPDTSMSDTGTMNDTETTDGGETGPSCDPGKDSDGDGLNNCEELENNTDPNAKDTDGDGLDDETEVVSTNTDPTKKDTDGDGLDDKTEHEGPTDPTKADTDGDGLDDKTEMEGETDPAKADTDNDGLDDGAEKQAGTDPTKKDTDGDGLRDGPEVNEHGSDPTKTDTDGDGIPDFAEVNDHGTDPAKADTDGDGLDDPTEIQGPTDPTKKDTDGDGLTDKEEIDTHMTDPTRADSDRDGLLDGDEVQRGTDPTKSDTDGDGLNDAAEVVANSDPTKKDTDGDGLDDGYEVNELGSDPTTKNSDSDSLTDDQEAKLGLDPNKADSFGDGTKDGNRAFVQTCLQGGSGSLNTHSSSKGKFTLTLPSAFQTYKKLTVSNSIAQSPGAAAIFSNSSGDVHGFVYSVSSNSSNSATEQLKSLAQSLDASGPTVEPDWFHAPYQTDEGHAASPGRWDLTFGSSLKPEAARDAALIGLAPFSKSDVSGFRSASGTGESSWRLHLSLVDRGSRLLVVGALAPQSTVSSNTSLRYTMADVVDTGALGPDGASPSITCDGHQPKKSRPTAEFYWVLDQSGSMDQYTSKITSIVSPVTSTLQASNLRYRHGVTNMDPNNDGYLRNPPAWLQSSTAFNNEIDKAVINCETTSGWACSGGTERALDVAKSGLTYMLGNGQNKPPQAEEIRQNADVYTFFQTNEVAHSINSQNTVQSFTNYFQGTATIYSLVGTSTGCATHGAAFEEISINTGGGHGSLCSSHYNRLLQRMVVKAAANSGKYKLQDAPIPSTIEVYLQGQTLSRSHSNGWDYVASENAVTFFGNARPQTSGGQSSGEFVMILYQTY